MVTEETTPETEKHWRIYERRNLYVRDNILAIIIEANAGDRV
jgi:hypothetical protein